MQAKLQAASPAIAEEFKNLDTLDLTFQNIIVIFNPIKLIIILGIVVSGFSS